MFSRLSLRAKIFTSFFILGLGLIVLSVVSFTSLQSVVHHYEKLASVTVPALGHLSGMRTRARQAQAEAIKLGLYLDSPEQLKKANQGLDAALKRYREISVEYAQVAYPPEEAPIFAEVKKDWEPIEASIEEIRTLAAHPNEAGTLAKIKTVYEKFDGQMKKHSEQVKKLDDYHVDAGEIWAKNSRQSASFMENFILCLSIFVLCFAGIVGFLITGSIAKALLALSQRLNTSSALVAENARTVSTSSSDAANDSMKQAQAVQETATAIEEISALTQRTAANAQICVEKADFTRRAAETSGTALGQMLEAMAEINQSNAALDEQVAKSNLELREMVNLITEVGEKTKVINEIVFQTKLLSFNASVESARAGEHGKGFAVVAEEISSLANMSGRAADEISKMITQAVKRTQGIVESNQSAIEGLIKIGNERVSRGRTLADKCRESLTEIASTINELHSMTSETTKATAEQSIGISEINKAMSQIDSAANGTAQASASSSDAAATLETVVVQTQAVIDDLNGVIKGRWSGPNTVAYEQSHDEAA